MKRIFICGPMSGLPENNYPAFNAAAAKLRAEGWHVCNPAEAVHCDTWKGYMRLSIAQLLTCEAMYLLPGWDKSPGAKLEIMIGVRLQIEILGAKNA